MVRLAVVVGLEREDLVLFYRSLVEVIGLYILFSVCFSGDLRF